MPKQSPALPQEKDILTVSALTQLVSGVLENTFPMLWVEGEISNLVKPASGHFYFSLKDSRAQVRCVMFRPYNRLLPFTPENGQHVLLYAKAGLYASRGDFQLIVEMMESAGDGLLRLQFEQLKLKLSEEGLFDARFKKAIPPHPKIIGIITSPTGAAIRDILHVLKRRAPYLRIVIYPTAVQGSGAASQIVHAIKTANARAETDVLILTRGGGSLEDLWPFNEEIVARAIFASKLPIITGIGHEIDFTIADLVSDLRAPTPSAAAELVSQDSQGLKKQCLVLQKSLLIQLKQMLSRYQEKLLFLSKQLKHPQKQLQEWIQRTDHLGSTLVELMQQNLKEKHHLLHELGRILEAVSPLATLNRGYAIVRDQEKHIIKQASQVHLGTSLDVLLGKGNLVCEVKEIK